MVAYWEIAVHSAYNMFSKYKRVQVGNDLEKAQSDKYSHSKKRGGKNQINNQVLIP